MNTYITSKISQAYKKIALVGSSLTLALLCSHAHATGIFSSSNDEILPVEKAFVVNSQQQNNTLSVQFDIVPKHYVYKDRVELIVNDTKLPLDYSDKATVINDPAFGSVAVFEKDISITTQLPTTLQQGTSVLLKWQGCAKDKICYPPIQHKITVKAFSTAQQTKKTQAQAPVQKTAAVEKQSETNTQETNTQETVAKETNASQATSFKTISIKENSSDVSVSEHSLENKKVVDSLKQSSDPFGLSANKPLGLLLLFIAGLGLAFTPCILPMLPIVANIVARGSNTSAKASRKNGFILSSSYAVGVATAYGMLGIVVAMFGKQYITQAMQNDLILLLSAVIFVLLALYMLGVITIRLPYAISSRIQNVSDKGQSKLGSWFGSYIAGFFSAIVVSPCVTAPLVGALISVASVGDPVFGFFALFLLGFGLSVPLIIVGTTQASILPKAGQWLDWVKQGFALLLFSVAILLIDRVFVAPWELYLWAVLAVFFSYWLSQYSGNKGKNLTRVLSIGFIVIALIQAYGAFTGNTDPLKPFSSKQVIETATGKHAKAIHVKTLAELEEQIQKHPKVMVDVWATWCVQCKIMDKNIFQNKPNELIGWQVVKVDISSTNPQTKEIMEKFNIFGPPTLIFFENGQFQGIKSGITTRGKFIQIMQELNAQE